MLTEVSTIIILVAIVGNGIVGFALANRMIQRKLQNVLDSLGGVFSEIFEKPAVSRAMTVLGKKGGEARAETAVVGKIASDVLNGPKFAGLKMAASALGLDIDSYIEEHGALATIQAMQSLGGMLGININDVLSGGMNLAVGSEVNGGKNPYL